MDHLAILNKEGKDWLGLILGGKKTIESRWYRSRYAPWNKIHRGDLVYLKRSGEPVTARFVVAEVLQFENLNEQKIRDIYTRYGEGIGIEESELEKAAKDKEGKNYCILVFIKDLQRIPPFKVSKKGFGMMSAWISLEDITRIKF